MTTFYDLPGVGDEVTLFTHLAVREDAHILYGFAQESDRILFRALLKVSGVGGKVALAILSGMTADEFSLTVQAGDVAALTRLPGIGKKTAERLVIEMRDRLKDIAREIRPPWGGLIVRTAAEGASKRQIKRDLKFLVKLWRKVNNISESKRAPSLAVSFCSSDHVVPSCRKAYTAPVAVVKPSAPLAPTMGTVESGLTRA